MIWDMILVITLCMMNLVYVNGIFKLCFKSFSLPTKHMKIFFKFVNKHSKINCFHQNILN